jgi:hypothetical protein
VRYVELEQTVSPPAREYGDPFSSAGKNVNGNNSSNEDLGSHSKREA